MQSIAPNAAEQRQKAARFFQAHLLALQNMNESADPITRTWYEARAEWYAEKSDEAFDAAAGSL